MSLTLPAVKDYFSIYLRTVPLPALESGWRETPPGEVRGPTDYAKLLRLFWEAVSTAGVS